MIFVYNKTKSDNISNLSGASLANAILAYLEIRRQCKEFVDKISLDNGGVYKQYKSASIANTRDWRPGMALYQSNTHAMILAGVEWWNNNPTGKVRVIDSNYATAPFPFNYPQGQIPWERMITSREFTKSASHYVVKLEN